jgi:hypothetical protein
MSDTPLPRGYEACGTWWNIARRQEILAKYPW